MEFNQPKGIYQQIADQVSDRIASGEWSAGEKIPSVREMAVNLGVNPNTVARSYQSLLDDGIIENRRGIGYFVDGGAQERIMEEMKRDFIEDELPKFFAMMEKLGMDMDEVTALYERRGKGESS